MNIQNKINPLYKWRLQIVVIGLYLLSTVPAFAILICNSPEYRNVLCSQSTEALKVFTAHLNAVIKDKGQCSNPPPSFIGIECEGEFPTITCPDDAPAQKAFLDALAICKKAEEQGSVPPAVTQPPSVTQPPAKIQSLSTSSTATVPPSSPSTAVVVSPETQRPSVTTRPRDPNAFKEYIPELPGYKVNETLIQEESVSQPMISKKLTESFKIFPRQSIKEEATIVIEVVP